MIMDGSGSFDDLTLIEFVNWNSVGGDDLSHLRNLLLQAADIVIVLLDSVLSFVVLFLQHIFFGCHCLQFLTELPSSCL